jgi:hypothetical protein
MQNLGPKRKKANKSTKKLHHSPYAPFFFKNKIRWRKMMGYCHYLRNY